MFELQARHCKDAAPSPSYMKALILRVTFRQISPNEIFKAEVTHFKVKTPFPLRMEGMIVGEERRRRFVSQVKDFPFLTPCQETSGCLPGALLPFRDEDLLFGGVVYQSSPSGSFPPSALKAEMIMVP